MDADGAGTRIARARRLAGLTQQQLAERAVVSVSLLRKVERGDRPATPAMVTAVARSLGVGPDVLYGQPYEPASRMEAVAVDELRRVLVEFDDAEAIPAPLPDIERRLANVTSLYRRTRYGDVAALLPDILRELHAIVEVSTDGLERERGHRLLAEAYGKAMATTKSLGHLDLAALAAERCGWAAQWSGDPLMTAIADYHRAMILLYTGAYSTGLKVIERASERTHDVGADAAALTVRGTLHLRGAIIAARASNRDRAEGHFTEAQDCGRRLADVEPADPYGTAFDAGDLAIHAAAIPLELMDPATALSRGANTRFAPTTPPSRIGHHHIDQARAWVLQGDRDRALVNLQKARRVAPELTRYHPQVRETVQALVRAERRRSDSLAGFARWAGIQM